MNNELDRVLGRSCKFAPYEFCIRTNSFKKKCNCKEKCQESKGSDNMDGDD